MRGYFFGLAAPFCWGLAATFIKLGLADGLSPVVGALIANAVAFPLNYLMILALLRDGSPKSPDRRSLLFIVAAGVLMAFANLFYFVAIDLAQVSIAVPLSNTSPIFTLGLARLFLRHEHITARLIIGTIVILAGVYLIAT